MLPESSLNGFQLRQTMRVKSQRGIEVELGKGKARNFLELLAGSFSNHLRSALHSLRTVMRAWASQGRGAVVMDVSRAAERRGGAGGRALPGRTTDLLLRDALFRQRSGEGCFSCVDTCQDL